MGIEIFGSTGIPVSPSVSGCYLFMSSCVFDIFRWKVMVTPHPLHASRISPFWHHDSSDIWPEYYQLQHIHLLFAVGNTISCSSWQTWGARKITVQHSPLESVQKAFFLCRRGPLYLYIACTLGTAQPCTGYRVDNTPWTNNFSESHFIILCFCQLFWVLYVFKESFTYEGHSICGLFMVLIVKYLETFISMN